MAAALVWLPALYRALRRAEGTSSGLAVAAVAGGALAATSGAMTALVLAVTGRDQAELPG
jgi:hypothetical protein